MFKPYRNMNTWNGEDKAINELMKCDVDEQLTIVVHKVKTIQMD